MIVFAHRGASSARVQNTVSAFAWAQKQGASCYELDVHRLADGQLAVHHDYSLLSTAGIDVLLKNLVTTDLKKYPLKNKFSQELVFVPLLQEVVAVIKDQLNLLNIELKNDQNCYPGLEKEVWDALHVYPDIQDKILFSSFDYLTLQRLRAYAPHARIGWLTRKFDLSQAKELGVESIHLNYTRLNLTVLDTCHAQGWKVYVYTVNDLAIGQQLRQLGVDGIFTDNPALFLPLAV